jgi:hypothetical protein
MKRLNPRNRFLDRKPADAEDVAAEYEMYKGPSGQWYFKSIGPTFRAPMEDFAPLSESLRPEQSFFLNSLRIGVRTVTKVFGTEMAFTLVEHE